MMTDQHQTTEPAITYAECGPPKTKCEHKWDGPFRAFEDDNGGEATCSKCGCGAFNMWEIWG
jgi:hypothetical protein